MLTHVEGRPSLVSIPTWRAPDPIQIPSQFVSVTCNMLLLLLDSSSYITGLQERF